MLENRSNGSAKGLELDFEVFEREIDKEIDALFVPFTDLQVNSISVDASTSTKGPDADIVASTETVTASPVAPVSNVVEVRDTSTLRTLALEPVKTYELVLEEEPLEKPDSETKQSDLQIVLEAFNVAYLSLDWDFTSQNLSELQLALGRLEKYCGRNQEAQALYKILHAVLQRLKVVPTVATPDVIELIRNSQDVLKRILMTDGPVASGEKSEVKRLIAQFQSLRESGIWKKPEEQGASTDIQQRPAAVKETSLPASTHFEFDIRSKDSQGLREVIAWLRSYRGFTEQVLEKIEEESKRLQQIEQILGKKVALAPLTSRVSKIRENMENHALSLRHGSYEYAKGVDWLQGFHGNVERVLPVSAEPEVPEGDHGARLIPAVSLEEPLPAPKTVQQKVYIFDVPGKKCAVLADQVVKVEQISAKKFKKIMDRGYACLEDFRPFFKSAKAGVLSPWSTLPVKSLKLYHFVPISYQVLGASTFDALPKAIVLVSNGRQHGAAFAESMSVDLRNEVITKVTDDGASQGVVHMNGGQAVEVLDLDVLLRAEP